MHEIKRGGLLGAAAVTGSGGLWTLLLLALKLTRGCARLESHNQLVLLSASGLERLGQANLVRPSEYFFVAGTGLVSTETIPRMPLLWLLVLVLRITRRLVMAD